MDVCSIQEGCGVYGCNAEGENILNNIAPEVLYDYIKDIDNAAVEYFENAQPVEEKYDEENDTSTIIYRTNIDPLSSVELTLTDCAEKDVTDIVGESIKGIFVDECYAATNGQTLWKKYGKRYYTAKYKRAIGPGYATICSENHYTLSKGRIKERYATTWLDSMASVTGDISEKGYSLYADATKPGSSTAIRTRVTFRYNTNPGGVAVISYMTIYEKLSIKFVKDDSKNKKMKVEYSWAKTTV